MKATIEFTDEYIYKLSKLLGYDYIIEETLNEDIKDFIDISFDYLEGNGDVNK